MKNISAIIKILKKEYPKVPTALEYSNIFELLIAVILSAQCTDKQVNLVVPQLFKKYKKPADLAKANLKNIEKIIRSTGFYKSKALSLKETAKKIVEKFGGTVPKTMTELLSLRGVARKTANVVLGNGYSIAAGIVVDTHVKRLAFRLGFSKNTNPLKIERDLMEITNKKNWIWLPNALINHGRKICAAKKPNCENCPLKTLCPSAKATPGKGDT
ncbi:MAG: endonuclease III [Elusimicrobia bacterium]|nr:endonuclease III [Elusimicrobiota bacterium]